MSKGEKCQKGKGNFFCVFILGIGKPIRLFYSVQRSPTLLKKKKKKHCPTDVLWDSDCYLKKKKLISAQYEKRIQRRRKRMTLKKKKKEIQVEGYIMSFRNKSQVNNAI